MTPRELRAARAEGRARRTYLCLEGLERKPSDYEITSTALLYHPGRGFAVRTPTLDHPASKLRSARWDSFADPAHFTYSAYVAERRDQEAFLGRLLERPAPRSPSALRPVLGALSALRFPLHGLQMVAAYVGAFAPSGRIAIAAAFQAADELRRVQGLVAWLSRSGLPAAELDAEGRELWQNDDNLQPLRRLIEQLLVSYDWGEALVKLNGGIKPALERLWFEQLALIAERHEDEVLEKILSSFRDDGRWHERWFVTFSRLALESHADNASAIEGWLAELWPSLAEAAPASLLVSEPLFGDGSARASRWREVERAVGAHLAGAGITTELTGKR